MLTVSRRIWISFVLVLMIGVSLTMMIASSGQQVSQVTQKLVEQQIPRLGSIEQMSSAIAEHERLLYEYYATTDRVALWPAILQTEKQFLDAMQKLKLPDHGTTLQLMSEFNLLQAVRERIDTNLGKPGIDWDLARAQLVELTKLGKRAHLILSKIQTDIEDESQTVAEESQKHVESMINFVALFSLAVVACSAIVGYFTQMNIRESAQRKTLALFPERNPSAVISLNWKGEVIYHNPACERLLRNYHLDINNIYNLLPLNFLGLLKQWQKEYKSHVAFTHNIGQYTLQYDLSLLPDLESCHLYIEDITDRQQAFEQLEFQAYHDQLTRLPNRRSFLIRLDELIQQQQAFSILLVSLDRFELVQSAQGYDIGDSIIKGMSKRLAEISQQSGETIQLFRMEGTRFSLLVESKARGNAELIARVIQQKMDEALEVDEHRYYFTTSIGICHYPKDADTAHDMVSNVNAALNQAKSVGDHYELYDANIHAHKQSWLPIETGLRHALMNEEFCLHYQGKVDADSLQVAGAEALIRWFDKDGKFISPGHFIPVAEQTGLIIKIGEWVIEQAFQQAAYFARNNIDISIAINISARQFQHRHFVSKLQEAISRYGISPESIELEITESLIMQNVDYSIVTMRKLKDLGFSMAIDDFGTGYSSLSYLKQFPISTLKIDRAFIMNLEQDDKDKSIVRSVLDLSKHLKLQTVAEGVETEWQWHYLRDMGCNYIQGFYFSKPDVADRLSAVGKGHRMKAS